MTPEQFTKLVRFWGGDEEAARKLHIKPRTVRALRTGERKITPRVEAFVEMVAGKDWASPCGSGLSGVPSCGPASPPCKSLTREEASDQTAEPAGVIE